MESLIDSSLDPIGTGHVKVNSSVLDLFVKLDVYVNDHSSGGGFVCHLHLLFVS